MWLERKLCLLVKGCFVASVVCKTYLDASIDALYGKYLKPMIKNQEKVCCEN